MVYLDMFVLQSRPNRLKVPKRPYKFGIRDISAATGRSLAAIRKDRQRGKVDPKDLRSLVAYVAFHLSWTPPSRPF